VALLHSNKPTGFPGANVHGTQTGEVERTGDRSRKKLEKKRIHRRHNHSHPLVATFGTTTDIAQ